MELKRLFWGVEVVSPWPQEMPSGRLLLEQDRHLTLAFLGDVHLPSLLSLLDCFPRPSFQVGIAALFDRPLFLPKPDPNTAGWHVHLLEQKENFFDFQKRLITWLKEQGVISSENRERFLAHVTLARHPFVVQEWKEAFIKRPLYLKNIRLCESLGMSRYNVCWNYPIIAPFESIEHTADMAFLICGENFEQLYLHAALALSFDFLPLLHYVKPKMVSALDELIMALNELIAIVDEKEGCPFKAISFHSLIREVGPILKWEMIVDV